MIDFRYKEKEEKMRKNAGYSRTEMLDRKFLEKLQKNAQEEEELKPSIKTNSEVQTLTRIVSKLK
jgi:hypothetical protein